MLTASSSSVQRNGQPAQLINVQYCIVVLHLLFALCYSLLDVRYDALIYPCCVLIAGQFIWSIWSWQALHKSTFDPYILFLVAATLFNGGQALLEVFHLNAYGLLNNAFSDAILLETVFLVSLCLSALHLGALLSVVMAKKPPKARTNARPTVDIQDVRVVGWGLVALSIGPACFVMRDSLAVVLSSGYFGLYQRDFQTGVGALPEILATFLAPGALFLLAGSANDRLGRWVSGAIIFSYVVFQLFLGSRAVAAMPLLAYAWLWHRCVRPIPKTVLIIAGTSILFVVFPLIAVIRDSSGSDRLSADTISNAFVSINNPAVAIISEFGSSMQTVAYTVLLVPNIRDFDYGVGYFYALLAIVPNLFWDIHPTMAHGLASGWLIWAVNPAEAAAGGGLGFSFIAEAYLNFGLFGAPVAMLAIGFGFGKLTAWATRYDEPAKMALLASFITFVLVWVRGESVTMTRPLLWYALLPYLCVSLVHTLRRPTTKR